MTLATSVISRVVFAAESVPLMYSFQGTSNECPPPALTFLSLPYCIKCVEICKIIECL